MAMQVVQSGACSTSAVGVISRGDFSNGSVRSSLAWNPMRVLDGVSCRFDGIGNGTSRKRRGGGFVVRAGSNKPGDKESKAAYDAFFLGRSLAEVVNERVGSAIGEFLSDVGRRQAERQKKIRQVQDEIKERAAAAGKKAAKKSIAEEKAKEESPSLASGSGPQPPPSTSGLSDPEAAP